MSRVIGVLMLAATLWSGWWYIASSAAERGVHNWLALRQAEGWQAEAQGVTRSGYPVRLNLHVEGPVLADPATGVALEMEHLDLSAPAWWPGDVTLDLPQTPIRMSSPDGPLTLQANAGQATLNLHPGPSLQLEAMQATSALWQITAPEGALLSGSAFTASMVQDTETAETYAFTVDATNLTPGAFLRAGLPTDWPSSFDTFTARMRVTFDTPWDRSALETRRPQPRKITIEEADIKWGALRHRASGDLTIDASGVPEGSVSLQVENWRQALDIAQDNGALAADFRPQAETILGMLSNMGGDPETLNMTLTFKGGSVAMGPIPLGPAPRIILR
ncbi:DUF2125 domain-containing protein [uncultured Sulfitobacter sp.]|uniref:DUF2125 domain-containing protein n=1 Tax=uncultured Sulfitobacter sp. TaxID=191468 RepID=UPI00260814ED|nr:DUF2125 domain-containing protein [uncultured Sulfitobacter sp.]